MNALWLLQCCRYGLKLTICSKQMEVGWLQKCNLYFILIIHLSLTSCPFPHYMLFFQQSCNAIMKLLAHFPTPFCHTPATVKYTSNSTIKSVCSQHGHAIGRPIMETEIYFWDQLCVWRIVPDLMAEREKLWRWVVQWHWPHVTAHTTSHQWYGALDLFLIKPTFFSTFNFLFWFFIREQKDTFSPISKVSVVMCALSLPACLSL